MGLGHGTNCELIDSSIAQASEGPGHLAGCAMRLEESGATRDMVLQRSCTSEHSTLAAPLGIQRAAVGAVASGGWANAIRIEHE